MRAKTINEDQKFERGKDPKSSMNIGGINIYDEYDSKVEALEMALQVERINADNEWSEYLEKTFNGKRITAIMRKLPSLSREKLNVKTIDNEAREFTIVVQDTNSSQALSDGAGRGGYNIVPTIIIADTDNNMYSMKINQKIYFG